MKITPKFAKLCVKYKVWNSKDLEVMPMKKMVKILVFMILLADIVFFGIAGAVYKSRKELNNPKIEVTLNQPVIPKPKIEDESDLIERQIVNATVQIVAENGSGTGVVIYNDPKGQNSFILTAAHVAQNGVGLKGFWSNESEDIVADLKLMLRSEKPQKIPHQINQYHP